MEFADKLSQERRARLAAERLLEQKQAELFAANAQLGKHARALSDEIVVKRQEVKEVRSQAAALKGQNTKVLTSLKIAERRLWNSIQTIQDGFAVFDSSGCMVSANKAYLSAFDGLEEVTTGITYPRIMQLLTEEGIVDIGDTHPLVWQEQMLDRWQSRKIEPLTIKLWNGTYVKLIDRRAQDGDTVSLALDITETIRYEARLKTERRKAEAANRAKSAFLANMSHEIRTPMNGVVGMADLLCDTTLTDEQRLYIETIKNSGEALLVIINDVLDYSKIEAEKLALHVDVFDLERCLHEVLTLVRPAAQRAGLELFVDFDLFMPTRFRGDAGRIRQILTNLIGNAVKFTVEGHVLVRVIGSDGSDDGQTNITVTIEDTGIGIPENMIGHVFGEFNQVEDERNRKYEGTGLGLAISRQLVELMEGSIWVESTIGEGSCFGFCISLPFEEGAKPPEIMPHPLRVMVADSNGVNAAILSRQLTAIGMTVDVFDSAEAAIAAPLQAYGTVVVSSNLPTMSCAQFLERLHKDGLKAPAIALLAHGETSGALEQLAQEILYRPLARGELYTAISRLAETTAPPAPAPKDSEPRRQLRVLAAEDNKTNQLVFIKMVKSLDMELRFANNGREAVALFKSFRPDMIFMDISMPEMDGKEATGAIRALEEAQRLPRTPITALTAHALVGDDVEILAAGLDHYLTKPLRKAAIIGKISELSPPDVRPPYVQDEQAAT